MINKLVDKIKKTNAPIVVGLDPMLSYLPEHIQKGKKADVVIFDPKQTYKIDKNTFASKGRNTPFDGREVTGRVKVTICDGNIVYGEN